MLIGSRYMLRMSRQQMAARTFATSNADYHSLDDQIFYTPNNKPTFDTGANYTVFNSEDSSERRFVPWEMKEITFKHSMGVAGLCMVSQLAALGPLTHFGCAGFVLNGTYRAWQLMSTSVRKIELHQDGKTVTLSKAIGGSLTVPIKDIKKLKHEKDLLNTFEEAYLFPIEIKG